MEARVAKQTQQSAAAARDAAALNAASTDASSPEDSENGGYMAAQILMQMYEDEQEEEELPIQTNATAPIPPTVAQVSCSSATVTARAPTGAEPQDCVP